MSGNVLKDGNSSSQLFSNNVNDFFIRHGISVVFKTWVFNVSQLLKFVMGLLLNMDNSYSVSLGIILKCAICHVYDFGLWLRVTCEPTGWKNVCFPQSFTCIDLQNMTCFPPNTKIFWQAVFPILLFSTYAKDE